MSTKTNPYKIKVGQTVYLKHYNRPIEEVKVVNVGRKFFHIDREGIRFYLYNLMPIGWPHYTTLKIYITKEEAVL